MSSSEDSFPLKSSRSVKTSPPRRGSPGEISRKKMKYSHSTGNLYHPKGEFKHYQGTPKRHKDRSGVSKFPAESDGKPSGNGRREETSRNSRELHSPSPNEDDSSSSEEHSEDETGANVHIRPATLRKEHPMSYGRSRLPAGESNMDDDPSLDEFSNLSPVGGVENLHITDKESPLQFTSRAPRTAREVRPAHTVRHQHRRAVNTGHSQEAISKPSVFMLDMKDGRNRLKTFQKLWPEDSEFFNTQVLVRYGFYAIGQGDAVRCFVCDTTIANWQRDDDARQRHFNISPDCRFMNGHRCGNRPLSPVRKSKVAPGGPSYRGRRGHDRKRRSGSTQIKSRSPIYHHRRVSPPAESRFRSHSPRPRRRSRGDRTRSFSSPPGSPPHEEPPARHVYEHPTRELLERTLLMETFPCLHPANPEMREESVRRKTFQITAFRSYTRLRASDATLAEAGLYYAGESDNAKCWYCNGGLRQFEPGDDPWEEHARYFPDCEYVLQQRGPEFVNAISARHPGSALPRSMMINLSVPQPPVPRQPTPTLPPIPQPQRQATPPVTPRATTVPVLPPVPPQVIPQLFPQPPRSNNPPPPPPRDPPQPGELRTTSGVRIEDPQAAIQSRERMVEESMQSEQVQLARQMGFTEDQIRTAQMRRVVGLGGPYPTADLLVESILNPDTDPAALEQPEEAPAEPQFEPQGQPRRNVTMTNSTIRITGGNFGQTVIGSRRGRSRIIIDGLPLHEYLARQREEAGEGTAAPFVFNNVGTSVGTSVRTTPVGTAAGTMPVGTAVGTTLGSTRPYNTAPTPSAPMMAETSTTPSGIGPSTSTGAAGASGGSTQQRLEALEKEYQCKICLSSRVEVLFEPCGHICACLDCGRRVTHCPVCRIRITRYIRTYHA